MVNGDYQVKYCVGNSLFPFFSALIRLSEIQNVVLLDIIRLVIIIGEYHVKYCVEKSLYKSYCIYNVVLLDIKGFS